MTAPDISEAWLEPVWDAVLSDIQRTGFFYKVQGHEYKRKPQDGLQAAMWFTSIAPIQASGLASTSARVVFNVRLYSKMTKEPQDLIDPALMRAVSGVMRQYHDDYDFGLTSIVRNVDLLGAYGVSLSCITGYLEQDGGFYRIADITVPVIINDVWPQVN